jgi:hypothetical protein
MFDRMADDDQDLVIDTWYFGEDSGRDALKQAPGATWLEDPNLQLQVSCTLAGTWLVRSSGRVSIARLPQRRERYG